MKPAVYRFFDENGALLYVGATLNVARRTGQHMSVSPWWLDVARIDIERFSTRDEAFTAEGRAIAAEAPRHNVRSRKSWPSESGVNLYTIVNERLEGQLPRFLRVLCDVHVGAGTIRRWMRRLDAEDAA